MKKIAQFFFLFLFSTIVSINLFAQNSDFGQDSKSGVTANYGITQEESNWLNSKTITQDIEIPQELLNQLEQARLNNDVEEVNRINNIINSQYRTGVKIINSQNSPSNLPLPEPITESIFPEEHRWLPGDVLVASDTGGGAQFPRTLDVKLGPDGNLYLASIVNTATRRKIYVYKSTNGGAVWTFKGGISYPSPTSHFATLSMLVEDKSLGGVDDSIRVIVYYTSAVNNNNDGASLSYFQFKPNSTTNQEYILKSLASPTTGREFNYVSAVSDGQYYTSATYFGCVVGEFSNNADTTIAYRIFRTTDWGNTHSSVTLDIYASNYNDKYPMAQFKASTSGSDSIYIVSERVFSTNSQIRVTIAPWTLSTTFKTNFLTDGVSVYYKKPVLAIKQSPRSVDKRMVITCTKDGQAKYHYSLNSGDAWSTDLFLDNRTTPSVNTTYTYVTSDSTGSSEDFCAMFSQRNNGSTNDSINVRRGVPGSMGTTLYKQNSEGITSTHPAVTAIYRDGGSLKSAFAYWANGPRGIYFDAENLVTDVSDLPGTVDKYELAQNYPNPFNPSTVIKFSVPEQANVTLKIFNSIGQQVATLLNGEISAGNHQVDFNASALSSGIYFYQISSANFTATKKMILIK